MLVVPGRFVCKRKGRVAAPDPRRRFPGEVPAEEVAPMIRRHWPAPAIALAVLAVGLNLQAQPPAATPATPAPATTPAPDVSLKELIAREQALEKQYKAFTTNLLALAQKLEKSDRIEDKDKAKALRKAIDLADKEGVDNKFTTLLRTLSGGLNREITISELT